MALPSITFNKGEGGLGRPLPNNDHVSGFVTFSVAANEVPWGTIADDGRERLFYSLAEAEAAGIIEDDADWGILWYHLQQYFLHQPKGEIYVGVYDENSSNPALSDIETLQTYANGRIRQFGVLNIWDNYDTIATEIGELQTSADNMRSRNEPAVILYQPNYSTLTIANIANLVDLITGGTNPDVAAVIGEDLSGKGREIAESAVASVTIGTVGAVLGTVAKAAVHESIAWVGKFKANLDADLATSGLGIDSDANRPEITAFSASALDGIRDKGYIFGRYIKNVTGTYWSDSLTAVASTSDYATIENNRTVNKAQRDVYARLASYLNSPLYVDEDGLLSDITVANFKAECDNVLTQMVRDGELSAGQTLIDPSQNVLSTSTLEITLELVPVGVARTIVVNIGFALSLSTP